MSQLSSSPAQQTMMLLERAKSFSLGLKFVTRGDQPVDLTGATVLLKVLQTKRYGSAVVLTETAVLDGSPDEGFMRFDLQASDLDLAPRTYEYSIVMHADSGYSGVIVKGELEIVDNGETESLALTYPGSQPSQSLTVLLGGNNEITVQMPAFEYPKLVIGSVSYIEAGNQPAATIRGRYPVQILDLSIPDTSSGAQGVSITSVKVLNGRLYVQLSSGVTIDAGALPVADAPADPDEGGFGQLSLQGDTPHLALMDTTPDLITPNKYIRAMGGVLLIRNSADAASLMELTDLGAMSVQASVSAPVLSADTTIEEAGQRVYSPNNPPPYPAPSITSVAGRGGAVLLTAADVGAGTFPGAAYETAGSLSVDKLTVRNPTTSGGLILPSGVANNLSDPRLHAVPRVVSFSGSEESTANKVVLHTGHTGAPGDSSSGRRAEIQMESARWDSVTGDVVEDPQIFLAAPLVEVRNPTVLNIPIELRVRGDITRLGSQPGDAPESIIHVPAWRAVMETPLQVIPSGSASSWVTVICNTELADYAPAGYNPSTGVYTAPWSGLYQVNGGITTATGRADGLPVFVRFVISGTATHGRGLGMGSSSGDSVDASHSKLVALTEGQTIVMQVFMRTSITAFIASNDAKCYFEGHYVRPLT